MRCSSLYFLQPHRDLLIAGYSDGTLRVFSACHYDLVLELPAHTKPVRGILVSPCTGLAFSWSWDLFINVLDLPGLCSRGTLKVISHNDLAVVQCLAAGTCGGIVLSGDGDGVLRLWDVEKGEQYAEVKAYSHGINFVGVAGSGRIAVTAGADKVILWNLEDLSIYDYFACQKQRVTCLLVTGGLVISGSVDGLVRIYDIALRSVKYTSNPTGSRINSMVVNESRMMGFVLFAGGGNMLRIFCDQEEFFEIPLHKEPRNTVITCIVPHENYLYSSDASGKIRTYDIKKLKKKQCVAGHIHDIFQGVSCMEKTADSKYIVSGGIQGGIKIWSQALGICVCEMEHEDNEITALAVSCDGRYVVAGDACGVIRVWSVFSQSLLLYAKAHWCFVGALKIFRNCTAAATWAEDGAFIIWDLEKREIAQKYIAILDCITSVEITTSDRYIITANGRTAKVWTF